MKLRFLGLHPTVLLLASTHFLVDGYGNIYPPLLPLLIPQLHLSLTAAGTLQMCFQMANSVAQLGFGHLADRWRPHLLLMAGPFVAVSLLSLIGLSRDFWMLGLVLVLGGLGGAAFHPPAAAMVHQLASDRRKAFSMAVHITGGSVGFALGPLVFAPFVGRFGLATTPLLMLPGLLLLLAILRNLPRIDRPREHYRGRGLGSLRPYAKPLALLYMIVVLRTLTALSFATFMPVMLTRRGMSVGAAGTAVAAYLFATGVGGFMGGRFADAWGARRIIIASLIAAVPFLATAPTLTGWMFVLVVSVGGFLLQSTLPVNVTFGQTLAPISAATVSSLMMGFAWGTGGISVPFVGMLADRIGIESALISMAFMPLLAAALALPRPDRRPASATPGLPAVGIAEPSGTDVAQ
jgi:MFS transporter, FSR family, fosmidomycin resistance protein